MIDTLHFPGTQKELHENFLFPKVCCAVSLHSGIQKERRMHYQVLPDMDEEKKIIIPKTLEEIYK